MDPRAADDKSGDDLERQPSIATASMAKGTHTSHQFGSHVEMKKHFGTIATLGIAFSILNSWVAEAGSLIAPISLGGSVTVIWGCLGGAIFTTAVCLGVAELASAMPGAGGPYHYTFMLAPENSRKFLSFVVGWCNAIAWWFVISSGTLFLSTFFQGMTLVYNNDYIPTRWQTYLIYILLLSMCTAVVLWGNNLMPHVTTLSLYWSLGAFFVCLITTVVMHRDQPYQNAASVYATFSNISGWDSNATAFFIGLILSTYNFLGVDAATHLSEEMPYPELEVPQAMVGALATGTCTSFAFLTAILFCVTDMSAVLTTPTGVPVLAIFEQATGSKPASIVLTSLIAISVVFSIISAVLVAGRTTWAFARDNGLPYSAYFSEVNPRSGVPVRATVLSYVLVVIYGVIYVGSSVAFQSMVGSSIVMLFATYAIPQGIVAFRGRQIIPERPFNLGNFGLVFNALSPVLVVLSTVVLCLPIVLPVTPESMNYLPVVLVAVFLFILAFWFLRKKGRYAGPHIGY